MKVPVSQVAAVRRGARLAEAAARLPGTAARLPGTAARLPGTAVRLPGVVLAAAAAVACAGLLTGAAAGVPSGAAGVPSGAAGVRASALQVHWGRAEEVPGLGSLNAGGNAAVNSVSCWQPGDCAAGGFYTDADGHQQAFVVDESNAVWGDAKEVPGTAALNAGGSAAVTAISCTPRGYCAAGGHYSDSKGNQQAFVVSETGGRWGTAEEIPGTAKLNVGGDASVESVSCPSAGNCAAGGYYQTPVPEGTPIGQDSQAYVVSESGGRWSGAEEVPGMEALSPPPFQVNIVTSVSCASAGNCTAGGFYDLGPNGAPGHGESGGFVLSDVNGRWHTLVIPKGGGQAHTVSCWRAGDCVAAGGSLSERQTNGSWGEARHYPALDGTPVDDIETLSCPSAGYCAVGGTPGYDASGDPEGAVVISEHNGSWGKAVALNGPAGPSAGHPGGPVGSISCASAGNCGAGGSDVTGLDENGNFLYGAFVAGERNGRWSTSEVPPGLTALNLGGNTGNAGVNSVSCPSASSCAAGGSYTDAAGHAQAWVDGSK
jgi:hypothetical protein